VRLVVSFFFVWVELREVGCLDVRLLTCQLLFIIIFLVA
jgi:hypothetical protein